MWFTVIITVKTSSIKWNSVPYTIRITVGQIYRISTELQKKAPAISNISDSPEGMWPAQITMETKKESVWHPEAGPLNRCLFKLVWKKVGGNLIFLCDAGKLVISTIYNTFCINFVRTADTKESLLFCFYLLKGVLDLTTYLFTVKIFLTTVLSISLFFFMR